MEIFSSLPTLVQIASCQVITEFTTGPALLLHPLLYTSVDSSNLYTITEIMNYAQILKEKTEPSILS